MKVTVEQFVDAIVEKVLSQNERIVASVADISKEVCREKYGNENVENCVECSENGWGDVLFDIFDALKEKNKDKSNAFSMRAVPSREEKWGMPYVFDYIFKKRVNEGQRAAAKKSDNSEIIKPSIEQVEQYLRSWNELENYHLQEDALDKLFFALCPYNKEPSDVLLKVAALNDFYSTNIFSVYPVAKHILSLDIDDRLKAGDLTLVEDIQKTVIKGKEKNFYSFATKYCSHHNPTDYPIYDSYVDKILRYFRDCDGFAQFRTDDLKNYVKFKGVLLDFRKFYGLEKYTLKEIDKYLWQLGKDVFLKTYSDKSSNLLKTDTE